MEKRNKNYHVKVYTKFMFDFKKIFTSEYTRWVYVYLKLINNYKIYHKNENYYPIDVSKIGAFFNIDRATVFECLKELFNFQLLDKKGRNSYKLESEDSLINLYNEANDMNKTISKEEFIPVHKNIFIDIFNSGGSIREAELYYYLVAKNKHTIIKEPFMEVNVKKNKICKDLKTDHRTLKRVIEKLLKAGFLYKEDNNKLITKSPRAGFEDHKFTPLVEKAENVMIIQPVEY